MVIFETFPQNVISKIKREGDKRLYKKSRYREGGGALHEWSGDGGAGYEREQQMSRSSK